MLGKGVVKKYVAGEILGTAYRLLLIPAKLIYHGTDFTGGCFCFHSCHH